MSYSTGSMAWRSVFRVSPMFALVWEQWRVTRAVVLVVIGVNACMAWLQHSAGSHTGLGAAVQVVRYIAATVSILGLALALLLNRDTKGNFSLGFPARQYELPMRRALLAGVHVAYRLVVFAGVAAFLGATFCVLDDAEMSNSVGVTLTGVCALAYLFAAFWTAGPGRIALGIALSVGLAGPAFRAYLELTEASLKLNPYLAVVLFTALFGGIALFGAARVRPAMTGTRAASGMFNARLGSVTPRHLTSPERALFWYEWRRKGAILPVCALAVLLGPPLLALSFVALEYTLPQQTPVDASSLGLLLSHAADEAAARTLGNGLSALVLGAWVTSLIYLILDQRDFQANSGMFNKIRPVPTRELAMAKLKMSACSMAVTCGILAALMLCSAAMLHSHHALGSIQGRWLRIELPHIPTPGLDYQRSLTTQFIEVAQCVLLSWALLWIPLPAMAYCAWAFVVAITGSVIAGSRSGASPGHYLEAALLWAPAALVAISICMLAMKAIRGGLLSWRVNWLTALLSLLLIAASVATSYMDLRRMTQHFISLELADLVSVLLLFTCLPAFAVYSQAAWVARLRYHR